MVILELLVLLEQWVLLVLKGTPALLAQLEVKDHEDIPVHKGLKETPALLAQPAVKGRKELRGLLAQPAHQVNYRYPKNLAIQPVLMTTATSQQMPAVKLSLRFRPILLYIQ